MASNAGGVPRMHMAYAASKAATAMFTRCLGLELAEHGVRCNVVSPGSTDTPMLRGMWHGGENAQTVIDGIPSAYRVGSWRSSIAMENRPESGRSLNSPD